MARWTLLCILWINLIHLSVSNSFESEPAPRGSTHQERRSRFADDSPPEIQKSERLTERVIERSISLTSSLQKVQDVQKKDGTDPVPEPISTIENESHSILRYAEENLSSRDKRQVTLSSSHTRDSIAFPSDRTEPLGALEPRVPPACRRLGVCEDVPDYPDELVEKLLKNLGEGRSRFRIDELEPPAIAQRIGSENEEIELCDFDEKVIFPRAASDRDGKWYYIVNQRNYTLQGVRVEVCRNHEGECSKIASFPITYKAMCKQKKALRHLTALDTNGKLIELPFSFPSCCSCVVTEV